MTTENKMLISALHAQIIRIECEIESLEALIDTRSSTADMEEIRAVLLGTRDRLSVRMARLAD